MSGTSEKTVVEGPTEHPVATEGKDPEKDNMDTLDGQQDTNQLDNQENTNKPGDEDDGDPVKKLKQLKKTAAAAVTRKKNAVKINMASVDTLHLVKSDFEEYMDLYDKYREAYEAYVDVLKDEKDKDNAHTSHEEKDTAFIGFRHQVHEWIKSAEEKIQRQLDRRSVRAHSTHRSRHSGQSSHKTKSSSASFVYATLYTFPRVTSGYPNSPRTS